MNLFRACLHSTRTFQSSPLIHSTSLTYPSRDFSHYLKASAHRSSKQLMQVRRISTNLGGQGHSNQTAIEPKALPANLRQSISLCLKDTLPGYQLGNPVEAQESAERMNLPDDILDMDETEFKNLISKGIRKKDKKGLIKLLKLLNCRDDHKNLAFLIQLKLHRWEIDMRNELIKVKDVELVKSIFPFLRERLLRDKEVFFDAIDKNDLELVQVMFEGGMKPLTMKDGKHADIFLYALYLRRLEIAKYLLDKAKYDIHGYYPCYVKDNGNGIDVRQYNEDRITPAYLAVVLNDPILLKTLIEWGADVNKPSWLAKPVFVSHPSSKGGMDIPLMRAIEHNAQECFNILMKTPHVDFHIKGKFDRTPLMTAMNSGRVYMLRRLVEGKADINARDACGYSAMMLAAGTGSPPLFKELMKAKPDFCCTNAWKDNIWHLIVNNPHIEDLCPLLIEGGIHNLINEENVFGLTPLAIAIADKNSLAVEVLLTYGANPSQKLEKLSLNERIKLKLPRNGSISTLDFAEAKLTPPQDKYNDPKTTAALQIMELIKNPPHVLVSPPK